MTVTVGGEAGKYGSNVKVESDARLQLQEKKRPEMNLKWGEQLAPRFVVSFRLASEQVSDVQYNHNFMEHHRRVAYPQHRNDLAQSPGIVLEATASGAVGSRSE